MRNAHVISVEADMCAAHVKLRSGGRSQNYMPPEAADALAKAAKNQPAAAALRLSLRRRQQTNRGNQA